MLVRFGMWQIAFESQFALQYSKIYNYLDINGTGGVTNPASEGGVECDTTLKGFRVSFGAEVFVLLPTFFQLSVY